MTRATLLATALALLAFPAGASQPDFDLRQAETFAVELERAVNDSCDPAELHARIDFDRMVHRGISEFEVDDGVVREFTDGIRRGFDLSKQLCRDVAAGGSYKLLRVRLIDEQPRALLRVVGDNGVNYHDLLLDMSDDRQIVDIFVHSNGEWLSQLVRRGFLPLATELNKNWLERMLPAENTYLENLPSLLKMLELYREGRYSESLEIFDGLPDAVKKNRNIMMQRLAIAMEVDEEAYHTAMADLMHTFPDDSSLGLVFIDYYFNLGDYERSLEMIDRVDGDVGGDPYLDFLRASVLFSDGRVKAAKRAARRAIEAEPELEDPYWTLVTISLEQREFGDTARLLTEIESSLGVELADLTQVPEFNDFVASDVYAAWVAERGGEPPATRE